MADSAIVDRGRRSRRARAVRATCSRSTSRGSTRVRPTCTRSTSCSPTTPGRAPTRSTPRSRAATIPDRWPACRSRSRTTSARAASPTTCSSRILEGWLPPYDATVVERLRDAGAVVDRQDEPRRVRDGELHRELRVRADPQPARPDAGARRVERGIGGRGRGRVRAARARLRHRRLDPPARRAVRGGRREADVRRGVALRPDRVRVVARPDRSVRDVGRRRRAAARGRSAATTRCDSTSIDAPAPALLADLERGVEGLRVGIVEELTDQRRHPARGARPRSRPRPTR